MTDSDLDVVRELRKINRRLTVLLVLVAVPLMVILLSFVAMLFIGPTVTLDGD